MSERIDMGPDRESNRSSRISLEMGKRSVAIDTGGGADLVNVSAPGSERGKSGDSDEGGSDRNVVRLSFATNEVGNGDSADSGTNDLSLDGGLAVRVQLLNSAGEIVGGTSRFDDEGIVFRARGDVEFEVRDQVSGLIKGDFFKTVALGAEASDGFTFAYEKESAYINGGAGNDFLLGSQSRDYIEGGSGNDRIIGGPGDDTLVGGTGADVFIYDDNPGDDRILDFTPGTDKINLSAYGIAAANVTTKSIETGAEVSVDSNRDGTADFMITVLGPAIPTSSDFVFG
jgi:Ca2+-binding RTX toxin-like protein